MINVTIVIPYPELYDKAEAALRENAGPDIAYEIRHLYGTNVDEMNLGDADIIVARGLTQRAIKRNYPESTVLELAVGAYDILHAVYDCRKRFDARKIAIIAADAILYDLDAVREMLGADLAFFQIADEREIRDALDIVERSGYDAVAGGLTACTLAAERGFDCSTIRTSEETLRNSIKDALNTASVMRTERAKAEISRSILHNSKDAILHFDETGVLTLYNPRAFDVLGLPAGGKLGGRRAADLFADADIVDHIRAMREAQGVIKTVNRTLLVFGFNPVRVDGHAIGVICTIQRVNEIQEVETKIRKELSSKGLVAKYGFGDIIHSGAALSETIATAVKYAGVDANVLLIGETGTGKELFAQSIHSASPRQAGPFVAVNCAAFSENLLESELFGYADGAFTGAVKGGKTGLFELAHGGTMFLDEIGEIPMTLQATLLRALQEGEIRRIGDDKVIPVNVRVIAATNIDLNEKVKANEFRMDLLYRLDVLSLRIPPLRRRREDISRIATHYMERYCVKYAKPGLRLTDDAMRTLESHDWPGNTRELKNVCERLAVLADDADISADAVTKTLAMEAPDVEAKAVAALRERRIPDDAPDLESLVDSMKMNRSDIASMLGISRTTLWRRMSRQKQEKNAT